ncbi:Dfp1/Him1 [Phlyctema vagabunda]|uniref:Dfp1/Him1 n=1 Tax=Phlyctema vagabunda TaxID=108571 RepID=A0ABR4PFD4_9HELO
MAAVSISPLPATLSTMSSRRAPLSNNSNAINSPYRAVAAVAASKHKRSYATIQREESYGQQPPAKKQMLDAHVLRTPPRQQASQSAEGRVFTRRSNAPLSAFDRKLAAASQKPQQSVTRLEKTQEEQLQEIRNWQRHHRKVFPQYVFYFESIPEDARVRYTKQVLALGAREAKFFSNEVTHVVTTRTIPPEVEVRSVEATSSTNNDSQSSHVSQPQTINPSLLDRSSETTSQPDPFGPKGKFTFDVPMNRRLAAHNNGGEVKRQPGRSADVLHRARELGMKIWSLEKLQRMMATMFDNDTQMAHGHNTRSNTVHGMTAVPRATREADLSQLLRNERINGPSDRDPTVATKEMSMFKGPFIYVHDIDEKQKPIMVREYAKVAHKEDGDWPQFRSVANGKCPFVEEVDYSRREQERENIRQQRQQQAREKAGVPRTRAAAAVAAMQPPKISNGQRGPDESGAASHRATSVSSKHSQLFEGPREYPPQVDLVSSSKGAQNAFVSKAKAPRFFGGEPLASGMQASNVTSAIRSQMISSTAAQPGAKAGTSKEVHGLQRKVLEKNSGGPGSYGLMSSHRMTDVNTAANEQAARPTRRRAQEQLAFIDEDPNPSEVEEQARRVEAARKAKAAQKRRAEKRDPKPGYCENCQDKFDDFDEHVLSRKHRKFADKLDNWTDLDTLLNKLARPLKPQHSSDY